MKVSQIKNHYERLLESARIETNGVKDMYEERIRSIEDNNLA